jgi:hypothetical protein
MAAAPDLVWGLVEQRTWPESLEEVGQVDLGWMGRSCSRVGRRAGLGHGLQFFFELEIYEGMGFS